MIGIGESPRFYMDMSVALFYLLLIIPSILVHVKLSKIFQWFENQCKFLAVALVLQCIISASKYVTDAYMISQNSCSFFLSILYSSLWDLGTYFLIFVYTLHLLLWGQVYETHLRDDDPLIRNQYMFHRLPKYLYAYLAVLFIIIVGTNVVLGFQFYENRSVCEENSVVYSAYTWNMIIYILIYFSVVIVTLMYMYYLYQFVFVSGFLGRGETKESKKYRRNIGFSVLLSLLCFFSRAILDLWTFLDPAIDNMLNGNPVAWNIYWVMVEVLPLVATIGLFIAMEQSDSVKKRKSDNFFTRFADLDETIV